MKSWSRMLGYVLAFAVLAGAFFLGFAGRGGSDLDASTALPVIDASGVLIGALNVHDLLRAGVL